MLPVDHITVQVWRETDQVVVCRTEATVHVSEKFYTVKKILVYTDRLRKPKLNAQWGGKFAIEDVYDRTPELDVCSKVIELFNQEVIPKITSFVEERSGWTEDMQVS